MHLIISGVRTFCPKPVAKMLENVGGASALLGLIAMATDVEELYAAVKALVCVVKSNKNILKDMERIQGYQVKIISDFNKNQFQHLLYRTVYQNLCCSQIFSLTYPRNNCTCLWRKK